MKNTKITLDDADQTDWMHVVDLVGDLIDPLAQASKLYRLSPPRIRDHVDR